MIINVDQIKESADIVSIIGMDVDLKRRGANHVGCCPFHEEKTPSFTVSSQKGIYKCFGCGKSGDAVSFIMQHRGLVFPEALEYVAKHSGTTIKYDETVDRVAFLKQLAIDKARKETAFKTLNEAYLLYEQECRPLDIDDDQKMELYFGRTYKKSTIEAFRLSIAPSENIISNHFKNDDDRSNLRVAGWIKASEYSTNNAQYFYDFFKGRLLFPVTDLDGNVLGISARDLTEKSKAKYINSPESDLFEKRRLLYGLPQAFKAIREKKFAFLVEGNADVIACHDFGLKNTVAALGTSFTQEQAKLLSKHTDVAIIAYDADALEKDVIQKAVELIVKEQMFVQVLELPDGHDPDSLLRDRGIEGWNEIVHDAEYTSLYDGIDWCILQLDRKTKHDIVEATNYAISLICNIDDESMRTKFCASISKILKIKQTEITRGVNDRLDSQHSKKNSLKPWQEKDAHAYGVYVNDDCFFKSSFGKPGYAISNFVILPIMLIKGAEESQRLIELKNTYGEKDIVSIQSDDFVGLAAMKRRTERLGNFLFKGKEDDYMNVKELIYAKFPTCYPITTMGLHKRGFFTWGNGITTPEGNFIPVNRYGVVDFEDKKYYLSTFSEIKLNIESDDAGNEDDPGEFYKYVESEKTPSFKEWASLFIQVFGDNGRMAMCWYIASMYRDIIFRKLRFFPQLNLFGPPGSGKTYMGWRLSALQGLLRDPIDLPNTSIPGLSRQVAQKRNGFIWCDEYTAELKKEKVDFLKSTADGTGRTLGRKSKNNATMKTPVNAAVIISGQVLPMQDVALFTRLLTLFFTPMIANDEQKKLAEKLEAWEDGRLTKLTAQIHTLRPLIEEKWTVQFMENRKAVKELSRIKIMERIINTYSIVATVFSILKDELEIPMKTAELFDFIKIRMEEQHDLLKGSEEVAAFFGIIQYLLNEGLMGREDIIIQNVASIKKLKPKSNDQVNEVFAEPRPIMFMYFPAAFGKYREYGKRQGVERLFEKKDLEFYLRSHGSFAGVCKGKSFSGSGTETKTKRAWMFYTDVLPVHFNLNVFDNTSEKFHGESKGDHIQKKTENHQQGIDFPHDEIKENNPFLSH